MAEISRRRADQLGDLVVGLELAAIDLEDGFRRAVQHLGERLHRARLAGAGRAEQQEDARRAVGRRKSRLVHLQVRDDVLHRRGLSHHLAGQHLDQCASLFVHPCASSHIIGPAPGRERLSWWWMRYASRVVITAAPAAPTRSLGFWTAVALVMGNMIGSGVFLLPASLAPFGGLGLGGWLLSTAGAVLLALVFARLSRFNPAAGGPYAFTRQAYGDLAGFLVALGLLDLGVVRQRRARGGVCRLPRPLLSLDRSPPGLRRHRRGGGGLVPHRRQRLGREDRRPGPARDDRAEDPAAGADRCRRHAVDRSVAFRGGGGEPARDRGRPHVERDTDAVGLPRASSARPSRPARSATRSERSRAPPSPARCSPPSSTSGAPSA